MKIQAIKGFISRTTGRGGLILRKHSPEILITTGVIGIITSTVMACRATLKVEEVLDTAKEKLDKIHYGKENFDPKEYSDTDYRKDLTVTYIQTGWDFTKLYGPSALVGIASISCILSAYGIMRKRNLALIAAYKAVEKSFSDYRKRVVNELGEDKDRQFKYGTTKGLVVEKTVDEKGKTKTIKTTVDVVDPNGISMYAKFFDESCVQWSNVPEYNLTFLKCQQNFANDLLQSRGHIFLNEVYDMLGIPRTQEGSIVGWVKGHGDDFIDFGIFDTNVQGYRNDYTNETIEEERREFVNGYRKSVLLDFNVDGVIWDKI